MRHNLLLLSALATCAIVLPKAANAGTFFYWAGSVTSSPVSGQVEFTASGTELTVTITNTATVYPPSTANMITSLIFDITVGNPGALTLISANAPEGLLSGGTNPQNSPDNVGADICGPLETFSTCGTSTTIRGGWEAKYSGSGLGGWASTVQYGLGTAGQGVFNGHDVGANGEADYGVAPAIGIQDNGGGVYGELPYTYHSATFILDGLSTTDITISSVKVGYGTAPEGIATASLTPPTGPPPPLDSSTPEPGTWLLLSTGSILVLASRFRKSAKR